VLRKPALDVSEDAIRARMKHRRARLRALPFMVAGCAWLVAGAAAAQERDQPCPEGRISNIFVDNHAIYNVDELDGSGLLRWFYSTANALHMTTREGFIRSELLFSEGDCYDPYLLEESGRILRGYAFLARADVFAVDQPDGTKHVVVDTQDEWTTQLDFGVSFDGGLNVEVLDLLQEDLLGEGIGVNVFYRQRKERKDIGAGIRFPRLFGTRTDGALSGGRTRAGRFVEESVAYPFVGEIGRLALRQRYQRRDDLFPYVVANPPETGFSHLLLPDRDERIELSVAGRLGQPGNLTLLGMGVSRETLEFHGNLEVARNNNFDNTAPAPPEADSLVSGQTHPTSTTHLNFFIGQRNVHFARVRGLDPLDGVQDIQLGTDVGLTLGKSVDVLTASGVPGSDDLYTRLRFYAGFDPGTSYIFLNAAFDGRHLFSGGADGNGWRDLIGEGDVYGYLRSRKTPDHTFFARVSAAGGWSMDAPFQLTLGGRQGVRGLREEDFPGGQRLLFTLEDRYFLHWPAPSLFDLGFTLFTDVGRVWPGDVPYGVDSGWKGTMGGGLRIGFPHGSRTVVRLDLAMPVGMDNTRGPIFRVTLYELLGLTVGFTDPQLQRSRRVMVGPDSFTTDRR
jgi:hypothetical protein